jgi:DNA-binding MarR family transcriptional regulator
MLRRERDPDDRRAACLLLTDAAGDRLERWRAARGRLVADALAELPARDVEALAAALPALRNLIDRLEVTG